MHPSSEPSLEPTAATADGPRGEPSIGRGASFRAPPVGATSADPDIDRTRDTSAAIDAIGDGILVVEDGGRVVLANPASMAIFGAPKPLTYADLADGLVDLHDRMPRLGARQGPVTLPMRSDASRWVEISTYPMRPQVASRAGPPRTAVVVRDVTDARRRAAVHDSFIGVLSHELRTPMTTIYGGAKLLSRAVSTLDEQTRREVFEDIAQEAERLRRLIEDVVALDRFGEVPEEVGSEPVLAQRLVPRVVTSEEGRWPAVTFRTEIEPDLPPIHADGTYLEQVLRNLLSNAAKYGGIRSVVTVVAMAEGDDVAIRVLDEGPGVSAAETGRLFELFHRSDRTTRSAPGAGIGLFVSERLMAAMGGRIWARPRSGGGSEFGIALPAFRD